MPGRAERRSDAGVAANARLTASNAVVLLVLLAAEGVTILRVRELRAALRFRRGRGRLAVAISPAAFPARLVL